MSVLKDRSIYITTIYIDSPFIFLENLYSQIRLSKEKHTFERDVRSEYDSRMIVERKAWQETIEDLEREINILRYEREQLDRNYCLAMDEMKTEFEIEKQQMYRRFSETHNIYEKKIKEFLNSNTSAADNTTMINTCDVTDTS